MFDNSKTAEVLEISIFQAFPRFFFFFKIKTSLTSYEAGFMKGTHKIISASPFFELSNPDQHSQSGLSSYLLIWFTHLIKKLVRLQVANQLFY
nr:MAG TPA: hypothetical protein [Caudoviricetes sp.]